MDVAKINIKRLCEILHDDGLSNVDIGKLLGVSPLQANLYRTGNTKTAGVKTALCAFRHITINDLPVVLSPFRGKQDVLDKVEMYEDQCAQIVRDSGYGNYNITTSPSQMG